MVGPFGGLFAYEVSLNGRRVGAVCTFDSLGMRLPTAEVFALSAATGEALIALRVRTIPAAYVIPAEAAASSSRIGALPAIEANAHRWHTEVLASFSENAAAGCRPGVFRNGLHE